MSRPECPQQFPVKTLLTMTLSLSMNCSVITFSLIHSQGSNYTHVPTETRGIPVNDSDRSAPQGRTPLHLDVPTLLYPSRRKEP